MSLNTGELTIADLLAAQFTSVAKYGIDNIIPVLQNDLAVHNYILGQEYASFCEISSDRQRLTGASVSGSMVEMDESGRPPTQKPTFGSQVAFPMRKFGYGIGWDRDWFKQKTPRDLALAQMAAEKAHIKKLRAELMKAMYLSSNYTIRDYVVDNISFNIKRLLNADGSAIPDGPNGEIFNPSTHTHYSAIATLTGASVITLASNVQEHRITGSIKVAFNTGDESTVRALTGFAAYPDPRLSIPYATATPTTKLDITRANNRAIGILGQAEVWIKPWALASYGLAWDDQAPEKPLVLRVPPGQGGPALAIAAEIEDYPLHAKDMEDYFGFGVFGRSSAAVLYFGGGSYTDPTTTSGELGG